MSSSPAVVSEKKVRRSFQGHHMQKASRSRDVTVIFVLPTNYQNYRAHASGQFPKAGTVEQELVWPDNIWENTLFSTRGSWWFETFFGLSDIQIHYFWFSWASLCFPPHWFLGGRRGEWAPPFSIPKLSTENFPLTTPSPEVTPISHIKLQAPEPSAGYSYTSIPIVKQFLDRG